MGSYRNLFSGLGFALATIIGAAAGSMLITPMLAAYCSTDRPTLLPLDELGMALGIILGAVAWQWFHYVWKNTDPPTMHG